MKVRLFSNINNGFGLEKDCRILKHLLTEAGHTVELTQFDKETKLEPANLTIHVETMRTWAFPFSSRHWWIPNPEFFHDWHKECLPQVDRVLCKTADAYRIFRELVGAKAVYTGFTSEDLILPKVQRKYAFLHVSGKSIMKGTQAVVDAWTGFQIPVPLVVVGVVPVKASPYINVLQGLTDGAMRAMMNAYLFHVCPSAYEGFGHVIHEAMACGNIALTTNAPPMNQYGLDSQYLINAARSEQRGLVVSHTVDPVEIHKAVMRILRIKDSQLERAQRVNRDLFLKQDAEFKANFLNLLST